MKENLEAQLSIVDKKKEELEHMQRQEIEKLEAISGLSAEEAKERMVESLKEEAKTQAQSYINDIMDCLLYTSYHGPQNDGIRKYLLPGDG